MLEISSNSYFETITHRDDKNLYHREDGPAYQNDHWVEWFWHGKHHRIDGPAVVCLNPNDLFVEYQVHGQIHRTDGPAKLMLYKHSSFETQYWINGRVLTFTEFSLWYFFTHLKEYDASNEREEFNQIIGEHTRREQ